MSEWSLAVIAALLIGYALVSRRLEGTVVTPPMLFVGAGLIVGVDALGLVDTSATGEVLRGLTTATLTVVLFADAVRIDLGALRRELGVPARLLGIGLPLTIVLGTAAAMVVFDLSLWPAAVLAVVLAPTDAALGQAVVTLPSLPSRIRQGLNVESGLNDGICVPLLLICLIIAEADQGLTSTDALRLVIEEIGFGALGGLVAGGAGAVLLRWSERRGWLSAGWRQIALLAVPVLAFGVAAPLGGSGFIAAFVAGITFGAVSRSLQPVRTFLDDQSGEVLGALTFVLFGAVILGPALASVRWSILLYSLLSLTVVRMIPVAVSLVGSRARPATVGFLGWFGPRGLASIVFALGEVQDSGLSQRDEIVQVVAITVALSVLLHGLTAAPWAERYSRWHRAQPHHDDLMESVPTTGHRVRGHPTSVAGDLPGSPLRRHGGPRLE